jgi:uncharacterized membrane protein
MIMIIGIFLTILAIIVASVGVFGLFAKDSTDSDAKVISNFFLFAIFLLLLAAVIKYVW